ncbi:MAG: 5'-nucleotidase, lipoprotein e(P4) family [Bryobacteraceae bacterium]|nr:5'-nucleotidase, lipoprotein e(P4) family [Bryobacteraceae bacterium]
MKLICVGMLLLVVGAFGQQVGQQGSYENLNAVAWVQTSAEYRALASQAYRAAEANLLKALNDRTWTAAIEQTEPFTELPTAVILDLDETVLDNSALQARLTAEHGKYTDEVWKAWVAEARAGLVPGAAGFLAAARAHGVSVFYVTNRVCDPKKPDDPTVAVLKAHYLPLRLDQLLCKTGDSDKSSRRAYVARGHRVLLLIGDDFNDFMTAGQAVEARRSAQLAYERYWGERWFVLPNPTYGSWERATGYKVDEKVRLLRK